MRYLVIPSIAIATACTPEAEPIKNQVRVSDSASESYAGLK